jgi:hypothetical protein
MTTYCHFRSQGGRLRTYWQTHTTTRLSHILPTQAHSKGTRILHAKSPMHCDPNATVAQQCVPTMTDHSCTRMVSRKCPDLVAPGRRKGGPWGTAPGQTIAGGQAPKKETSRGRAQTVKPQGLNNPGLEQTLGAWASTSQPLPPPLLSALNSSANTNG